MVNVCMYIYIYIICGERMCLYLIQPHPMKTRTLEKSKIDQDKKKYFKKNKIHSVKDGIMQGQRQCVY